DRAVAGRAHRERGRRGMTMNAETPRGLTGAFQKNLAGGEAAAIVEQARRRRDAASRCEPFDCGHRDPLDCTAAGCGEESEPDPGAPEIEPGDLAALWANAKTAWLARDFPTSGRPGWIALGPERP